MSMTLFRIPAIALALAVSAGVRNASAADDPSPKLATDTRYKTVQAHIKAKEFSAAMPVLATLQADYPSEPDVFSLMGFSLRKSGRYSEALKLYGQALMLDPRHLGANEYLGELYAETGKLDLAKERLAVLEAACSESCEEREDLAKAIAAAERK